MDYFSRKSLSKYFMDTINFNKHDIDIFINDMWQKYVGNKLFLKLPDQFKPDFDGYTASLYAKLYTLVDKRGWQYIEGEIYIQTSYTDTDTEFKIKSQCRKCF
jgi:hypothetical protein